LKQSLLLECSFRDNPWVASVPCDEYSEQVNNKCIALEKENKFKISLKII